MWTHNFFLIFSMMSGNGADASATESVMPPLVSPSVHSFAQSASGMKADASLTRPLATTSKPAAAKIAVAKVEISAPPASVQAPVLEPIVAPSPSSIAAVPQQPMLAQFGFAQLQPRVALAPDASTVIGKVQEFYNQTKSFSAVFTQTVTNQTFNKLKPKVSKGKVFILKPGKMRWDYKNKSYKNAGDPKVSKSFISDGTHLWAVMHKNKQYYKEELDGSTLPVAVSFLMGTGDLRKEFDVAFDTAGKFGSKSDILLVLTPKQPSARYKKLWLVVDPANHAVKQSIVLNSKGDTNAIRFSSAKVNDGKLKNGHFIFNAKANKGFRLVTPPKSAGKK